MIYVEPNLDLVTLNAIAIAPNKEATTCKLHSSSPFRRHLSAQTLRQRLALMLGTSLQVWTSPALAFEPVERRDPMISWDQSRFWSRFGPKPEINHGKQIFSALLPDADMTARFAGPRPKRRGRPPGKPLSP
jgi:hypothetical protein